MTNPSTMPAVKVLLSQIVLVMSALKGRKSTRLGATVSIAETDPSPGNEVEESMAPRSQPMKFMW
jgi:hypothetical protein